MFALLHRALVQGPKRSARRSRLTPRERARRDPGKWKRADPKSEESFRQICRCAGVVVGEDRLALNRPRRGRSADAFDPGSEQTFAGLDFRVLTDTLKDGRSLGEIWRTFLFALALASSVRRCSHAAAQGKIVPNPRPPTRPRNRGGTGDPESLKHSGADRFHFEQEDEDEIPG
jgi:hypothetical protein